MECIEIHKSPDRELIDAIVQKRGWVITQDDIARFQEDSSLSSAAYPIYGVADGVTLFIEDSQRYPVPSGAYGAARIFCEQAVAFAEQTYERFQTEDVLGSFVSANEKIGGFNTEHGLSDDSINYLDTDLFGATASLAVIREGKLFWGNVCDSGVAVVDRHGVLKFRTDDGWGAFDAVKPENWNELSVRERTVFQHKHGRNRVDGGGNRIGYGTLNGEPTASRYVDSGVMPLEDEDRVLLYTDGFAPYFDRKEFLDIVGELPENAEDRIRAIQFGKESFHDLYEYHSEGTLLVIPYRSNDTDAHGPRNIA